MIKIIIEIDNATASIIKEAPGMVKKAIVIRDEVPAPVKKQAKKGVIKTKVCHNCGKEFTPTSNVQKYCSLACRPENKNFIATPTVKEIPEEKPKHDNIERPTRVTEEVFDITPEEIERSKGRPYSEYRNENNV